MLFSIFLPQRSAALLHCEVQKEPAALNKTTTIQDPHGYQNATKKHPQSLGAQGVQNWEILVWIPECYQRHFSL